MKLEQIAGAAHYVPGRVNIGVLPMDPAAYLLNAAAVKAHLSAHVREGHAILEIQDHRPIWRRLP